MRSAVCAGVRARRALDHMCLQAFMWVVSSVGLSSTFHGFDSFEIFRINGKRLQPLWDERGGGGVCVRSDWRRTERRTK